VTSAQESTRQAPGTTPVLRPSGDVYGVKDRVVDGMAMAGDRLVRGDDVDPRLADVAAPVDAGVRRAEPGPRSSFDRAR
jgi:hypothetical protein